MTASPRAESMTPGLLRVMERAKSDPTCRFTSLVHLLDQAALERAYRRLRKGAATGVDGVTKEAYGQDLQVKLTNLHARLKAMTWRHQPIRRVQIPKEQGKTRPIGISTVEDRVVQEAVREVLEGLYEPQFRGVSYGFRPGRSAHDALRALNGALVRGNVNWILEADIASFFDSIDRTKLMEMLQERVADSKLLRLVGKCLHVGVLEGQEYSEPDEGTVQGSGLSPLLGNIYLHHVLDLWVECDVCPRLQGKAILVRYADDFVIGFEREDDASKVMGVIGRRFERYGLRLHPDKTRLLSFRRPRSGRQEGKGSATFDFLGFTLYWGRTRVGRWMPAFKTRKARLRRAMAAAAESCRRHRHEPVKEQHATLTRKLVGHFNYFGVNGNLRSLARLAHEVRRSWRAGLGRRSQQGVMTWARFNAMLRRYPLPTPRIRVQIWRTSP